MNTEQANYPNTRFIKSKMHKNLQMHFDSLQVQPNRETIMIQ